MNEAKIDAVARGLAIVGPRRRLLGGLSGAVLTLLGAGAIDEMALAARRRRRGPAPCPRPLVECGKRCVRIEKNRRRCGGCRQRCAKGEICRKWRCRSRES